VIAAALWFLWYLAQLAYHAPTSAIWLLIGSVVLGLTFDVLIAYGLYWRISGVRLFVRVVCVFTVCCALVAVLFRNQVWDGRIAAALNKAFRGRPTALVLAQAAHHAIVFLLLTVPASVRKEFTASEAAAKIARQEKSSCG